jgi:hypothetical protein
MTPRSRRIAWPLLAALLALPRGAAAHEFWIAPSRYDAASGATLELSAVAGTGFRGERKPWSPDHAVRFTLRTAKAIDLARAASPGDMTWTRFVPADDGGALVAFESDFLPIELPAAQFNHYLKSEGLDAPLAARKGLATPGRERYRRCAKAWLPGSQPDRATAPVGLPLELVPESAPGSTPELRLCVLWSGRPLAGALVKAWRTPLAASGATRPVFERDSVAVAWQGRSDAAGRVTIPVREAGEWLVSVVHMEASHSVWSLPGSSVAADWESTWASLTFARTVRPTPALSGPGASSPAARGSAARP